MLPFLKKIFGMNWILFAAMIALTVFGFFAIYSATWMRDDDYLVSAWKKQLVWACIGLAVYFVVSLVDYRWVRYGALPLYILGLALLILVRFKGKKVYGARSWLDFGPVSFQPSQLAILSALMVVALILSEFKRWPPVLRILLSGVAIAAPWFLILVQPDLGSALVWIPMIVFLLFVGSIPMRYLVAMGLAGLAILPAVIFFVLKEYQLRRLLVFLDPTQDPLGDGWTINQSMMAIGSGGFQGKGFMASGTLTELGFLPATIVHNDFVFSVIGETFGFVGGAILICVFALLIITGTWIAYQAEDDFGLLLATGIVAILFTHVVMNIGMTIQLTPITGLPLPLVSYGGSFVLTVMFSLGLLQSVWVHRHAAR